MCIKIRAGLVYNLATDDINRINNHTVICILYAAGKLDLIKELSYYTFLIDQYTPDTCGTNTEYESIIELFKYHTNTVVDKFIDKGYTYENIAWMSSQMLFIEEYLCKDNVVIDTWGDARSKIGYQMEIIALDILRDIGFIIDKIPSSMVLIEEQDINIELYGRPDGIITYSPGDCIKAGTLIEVKYKYRYECTPRDIIQMASYAKIHNCDVLYVCIIDDKTIKCTLFKCDYLIKKFATRFNIVVRNSITINNLIENIDDEQSYRELINMCKK